MRILCALILMVSLVGCRAEQPTPRRTDLGDWILAFAAAKKDPFFSNLPISLAIEDDEMPSPILTRVNGIECMLVINRKKFNGIDDLFPVDEVERDVVMQAMIVHEFAHCQEDVTRMRPLESSDPTIAYVMAAKAELYGDVVALSWAKTTKGQHYAVVERAFLKMRTNEDDAPYDKLRTALDAIIAQNIDLVAKSPFDRAYSIVNSYAISHLLTPTTPIVVEQMLDK